LDAGEGEAGEIGLCEVVPVAGVGFDVGAGGVGGGLGVVPPGVAELGLLEAVGGVREVQRGEVAEAGVAAHGEVGEADGPLAFAERVEASDEEVGVGIGGVGGEMLEHLLDFRIVGDEGAEVEEARLNGGDEGDVAGFVGSAFGKVDELLDGGEVVEEGGFVGGVEGEAGGGFGGGGGSGGGVALEEGLFFERDGIEGVETGEFVGGGDGGGRIAGEGGEFDGVLEEDVAGGGIIPGGGGFGEEALGEGLAIGGGGFGVIVFEQGDDHHSGAVLGFFVGDGEERGGGGWLGGQGLGVGRECHEERREQHGAKAHEDASMWVGGMVAGELIKRQSFSCERCVKARRLSRRI